MTQRTVANTLACSFQAYLNCQTDAAKADWADEHKRHIVDMCRDLMPSGSGIDSGTTFDFAESKPERLVFHTAFHHMDDGGGYDGWTAHKVIVSASLVFGLDIRITGRNRNEIKDYLHEVFEHALTRDVVWDVSENGYRHVNE